MKKLILMMTIVALPIIAWSKEERIKVFKPKLEYGEKMFLSMDFGNSSLTNRNELKQIEADQILKVEVVCTDFPRGIDLTKLNAKRLKELHAAFPDLKNNKMVAYKVLRQTDFKGEKEARKLFHGVVITYKPKPTAKRMKEEIALLNKLLEGKPIEARGFEVKPTEPTDESHGEDDIVEVERRDYSSFSDDVPLAIPIDVSSYKAHYKEGSYDEIKKLIDSLNGPELKHTYTKKYYLNPSGKSTITYWKFSEYGFETVVASKDGSIMYKPMTRSYTADSTIFKIMKRNDEWSNMMIAADLTGSMYAYTAQVLAWLQLQTKRDGKVKGFSFFNDGDRTPDRRKVIGRIGGVYLSKTSDYEEVKKLAQRCMSGGGGGDGPENNIEGLLKGLRKNPDAKDIVMIADNWAPIKDMKLADKVDRPVKVILCGVYNSVNPDYLNLARMTGGSVHTIESDLTNLAKMNEGEEIEIFGEVYQVSDGKFVLKSSLKFL